MSRLSVYWPDECEQAPVTKASVRMILPFHQPREPQSPRQFDVVSRARILFENRRCKCCGYPVVEPVELDDALVNATGLEIPGTATLIGFECQSCEATWPAS